MGEAASTTTPRERYRQQVRSEIKERAWEQITAAGTSALSLNGIARLMGLSGTGLYRYFTSRDELLTELVHDAYQSLVGTLRNAAAQGKGDLAGLGQALRIWALDDPQRYFLVYGPPVPGYRAPADVAALAAEIMDILTDACADVPDAPASTTDTSLENGPVQSVAETASAQRLAISFRTRLHGVLSLELSGHFAGMDCDPALLYQAELDLLASH
ncbi:TetR/AcrR family transcriptional regulator [Streptomyces avidinii]|uniref:AcrR family transcriptional regulator n=1 Tax=Streptomyces avidinii TaxID=1895 RepID=A0ABS4KXQ5_STRAV|nr:TetR/AcrR family transcriptional regulator [Streptomyces avidinii]MBP2034816.1 AcrR family transcriptional regulator [Streptomyces avidinii]GGY89104.1 TetR family transcriptional regulator [Streptomyces avidinii]